MRFICSDCNSLVNENEVIIGSFEDGTAFFCESCFSKLENSDDGEEEN